MKTYKLQNFVFFVQKPDDSNISTDKIMDNIEEIIETSLLPEKVHTSYYS